MSGQIITGIDAARALPGVWVYAAGVKGLGPTDRREVTSLVTNGGRVLAVTGRGDDPEEARSRAYQGVELIDFDGRLYRRDIGS